MREFIKEVLLSWFSGVILPGDQKVREDAYKRANGLCECTMRTCNHHTGRCEAPLIHWELHRISMDGKYTIDNVIAICETCRKTQSPYES
jgi:hypothetical protein